MPANELDELKLAWQSLNQSLERQHALSVCELKERKLMRFQRGLSALLPGRIVQLIAGLLVAVIAGNFWVDHLGAPHLVVCGLLLHGYGIMLIVFAARELTLMYRIEYSAPVLAIQKGLVELARWRVRSAIWSVAVGCFTWLPLLLILLYAAGADVWLIRPLFVYLNLLACFLCLGVACAIGWWSRRPGQEKLAQYFRDSFVGRRINQAQAELAEIERFERE